MPRKNANVEQITIGGPVPQLRRTKAKTHKGVAAHVAKPVKEVQIQPVAKEEARKDVKSLLSSKEAVASPKRRRGRPKKQKSDS